MGGVGHVPLGIVQCDRFQASSAGQGRPVAGSARSKVAARQTFINLNVQALLRLLASMLPSMESTSHEAADVPGRLAAWQPGSFNITHTLSLVWCTTRRIARCIAGRWRGNTTRPHRRFGSHPSASAKQTNDWSSQSRTEPSYHSGCVEKAPNPRTDARTQCDDACSRLPPFRECEMRVLMRVRLPLTTHVQPKST